MKVILKNGMHQITQDFPVPDLLVWDVLDRMHQPRDSRKICFEIVDKDAPEKIRETDFCADICAVNEYAKRLAAMPRERRAVHEYLLQHHTVQDFMDALRMTYRLETVPVIPAYHATELGRFVIEHRALPDLKQCSELLLSCLDEEKIGKRYAALYDGIFTGGYYCEPKGYRMPDKVDVPKPEESILRLRIVRSGAEPEWIVLPTDRTDLEGLEFDEYESALPFLKLEEGQTASQLNAVADRIAALSFGDLLKLKAVAVHQFMFRLCEYEDCLAHLDEYDFDASVTNRSDYAKTYLVRQLPPTMDVNAVLCSDLTELGSELLRQQRGLMTAYGALSGEGMELYPTYDADAVDDLEETLEGGQSL